MRKTFHIALLSIAMLMLPGLLTLQPPPSASAGVIFAEPTATSTRTPTPINIGNFVWRDLDQDGIQDAGEPGIPGLTVQLWNAAKTQFLTSTVTNANGNYTVVAPVPGDYRVRVILPSAGDAFSPKNAGANDLTDSDTNPSGIDLGFTDIFNIASNVISITSIDIGLKIISPTPTPKPSGPIKMFVPLARSSP